MAVPDIAYHWRHSVFYINTGTAPGATFFCQLRARLRALTWEDVLLLAG